MNICVTDTGLVYRNPKPYLRSVHAWHPSIVVLSDGRLLCGFDLGEAVESLDYRTYTAESGDGGKTWTAPRPLMQDTVTRRSTHSLRLGSRHDGTLIAFGGRFYRDNPEEGLINRANLGYVPMDLIQLISVDQGQTWQGPITIEPPLVGPGFEICHRVIELRDGRCLAPTATWRGWNGEAPHGMQAIALVSYDHGQTWPEWLSVADQSESGVISWEQGLTELSDGRLLAIVWCYDEQNGKSLPSRFAISSDGRHFSTPRLNGMNGETAKILTLADGRVLCVYRRVDKPGLWTALVEIEGETWHQISEAPIWQGTVSGMLGERTFSGDELSALKFGFPSMVQLPEGEILTVFWCLEDGVHNIRWIRLRVS
jgi:hypothetical protein